MWGAIYLPKFAISQSEAVSTVLISCVIKPLTNMATLRRSQDFSKGWGGVGSHHGRVLTRIFSCRFRHLLCVFCLEKKLTKGTPTEPHPCYNVMPTLANLGRLINILSYLFGSLRWHIRGCFSRKLDNLSLKYEPCLDQTLLISRQCVPKRYD